MLSQGLFFSFLASSLATSQLGAGAQQCPLHTRAEAQPALARHRSILHYPARHPCTPAGTISGVGTERSTGVKPGVTHGRADTGQDIPAKPIPGFILAKTSAAGWTHRVGAPHFPLETTRDLHVALHHPQELQTSGSPLGLVLPRSCATIIRLTEPLTAACGAHKNSSALPGAQQSLSAWPFQNKSPGVAKCHPWGQCQQPDCCLCTTPMASSWVALTHPWQR